ncbi:MAG: IS1634 family transposase [Thermoplasmata archaeon]
MSYIVHQKINGKLYAYEVTGIWDPEKKNSKQKRKYLGRVDPDTGEIIKKREPPKPMFAYDYGDVRVAEIFYKRSGLEEALKKIFGKDEEKIKILIISRLINQLPLKRIGNWYERIYLAKKEINLSSQRISELLRLMEERIGEFFNTWIERNERSVYIDITSLSSNSSESIYEYGYSRDNIPLPQVNLAIVLHEDKPLFFQIYPGSVPDVVTLNNTLEIIDSFGLKTTMILDRGFFSHRNMENLRKREYIIPVPFTTEMAKLFLSIEKKKLKDPGNAMNYNGKTLFVVKGKMDKENYYIYYDPVRESEETNNFFIRLMEMESRITGIEYSDAVSIIEEHYRGFDRFIEMKIENGKIKGIKRKRNAISQYLNRKGKMILLTNTEMDWLTVLDLYRSRDRIEKSFKIMKDDLEGLPLRIHDRHGLSGYIAMLFFTLIVELSMMKEMRNSKLVEKYSIKDIFMELSKIRMIELSNGNRIITEIPKKVREILSGLNVEIEDLVIKNSGD